VKIFNDELYHADIAIALMIFRAYLSIDPYQTTNIKQPISNDLVKHK